MLLQNFKRILLKNKKDEEINKKFTLKFETLSTLKD